MKHEFEYMSYAEADRIAMLENRAAELERRLLEASPRGGFPAWDNVAVPEPGSPGDAKLDESLDDVDLPLPDLDRADVIAAGERATAGSGPRPRRDGRTESLINHGRRASRRSRTASLRAHWRLALVGATALLLGIVVTVIALPGGGGSWPASVAQVKNEIKEACQNPDVAAEPSGLNFACGKQTQPVLWVFSLLTSGDNPGFVDQSTGRKGLEPIEAAQGGDIAWSLNLHHPYNPASATDSLAVAARAINNIISGATLTSSSGGTLVEPGLESKPANCQRYTGSAQLVKKEGYPARCAAPISSPGGEGALVSDVFEQWMGGSQSQLAREAATLFENANNPGSPQVQAILLTLPAGS